jgi:hypothetical protein
MADYVFGFVMYGIGDPWSPNAVAPVLYTKGIISATDPGLPAELTGCTIHTRVTGLPGVNWGADPRHPTGFEESATLELLDDALGTLGTLFLKDDEAGEWGLETNRLASGTTSATFLNLPSPTAGDLVYLGNEAITLGVFSVGPSNTNGTTTATLTRARCGSSARAHVLHPSDYKGNDGEDRLYLRSKPDWEENFLCGLYLFRLDQYGAIEDYVLRRGVVDGEPTPTNWPHYQISVKLIEDRINSHTVGEQSKEITLSNSILVHALDGVRAKEVSFLLRREQAEQFFNEPLGPRSSDIISSSMISNFSGRLLADPKIVYQIKLKNDYEWIYKITQVSTYTFNANGVAQQRVRIKATLEPGAFSTGASSGTATAGGGGGKFRPWYQDSSPSFQVESGGTGGPPPVISLRLKMIKRMTQAFLILAISRDGSTGGAYDKLIGGFGAGLPAAYFNTGSTLGNPLLIPNNINEMLQLDQLLDAENTYYFDLTRGVSLKDFLTNEFIASQVLLGSRQNGIVTIKSWIHNVASTVTLNPLSEERVEAGKRLATVKRLDLSAGTNVLTLEPKDKRSVRFGGTSRVREDEVQPIRFWRDGINLSVDDITVGDLSQLVRAFYKVFGGSPRVYEVPISIGQYLDDAIEFADAVAWSDAAIPTPQGIGISDEFFVVGVDLNYDKGIATLKLLQNTLFVAPVATTTGTIAPTLNVTGVTPVSGTVVDVSVGYVGGAAIDLATDFGNLWASIEGNIGVIRIDNYRQAPVGEKERNGSVLAHATIEILTASSLRLTVDADYLRGSYTTLAAQVLADETKLNLPSRMTDEATLDGVLVEADELTKPTEQNFVSLQPRSPSAGAAFTFGV